jgi:small GTP-binding protein
VLEYKGARIQLLDLPGIVEGASQGRGRGRQVVSTAKTADLILIMLDATKSDEQRRLLEHELDAVGIRLNKNKPDVVFKKRTTGGITVRGIPHSIRFSEFAYRYLVQYNGKIDQDRRENDSYNPCRI